MDLTRLQKIGSKRKRRTGRGAGSGRGKTAGRGTKGQKARNKVRAGFEGGQTPLIKRLPLARGTGNQKKLRKPVLVNLKFLDGLSSGSVVNLETLISKKIIDETAARKFGVKILGDGEIKVALKIYLPISNRAADKIKAAGGQVFKDEKGLSSKSVKPEEVKNKTRLKAKKQK